ncbi:MAG: SsrA-binding protein SmpB, partial [Clostridia bacterium]|nr:SsrA-binding protein SmpB [Clostridia bacterium]
MSNIKVVATNKKAYHDYFIEDTIEAGIVLVGSEVKSIRQGAVNMKDTYCLIRGDEMQLINMHISPYEKGSYFNEDSRRARKLLLKKAEINKLRGKVEQKGFTLVPTKIYFKQALVKVEIGVAKGKELHDKRQTLKEKQLDR